MKKSWEIEVDGRKHTIVYKAGLGCKLIVDGETYKIKSSNWIINVVDYLVQFGTTECRLVVIGTSVDLAVNGTFLNSQLPYEPVANVPAWTWILAGISVIGGMFYGGILCLMIGLMMTTMYAQFALRKKTGAVIGCFIGCTILQIVLGLALAVGFVSLGLY